MCPTPDQPVKPKSRLDQVDDRLKVIEGKVQVLENQLADQTKVVGALHKAVKPKTGLFGQHRERSTTKDTVTGIVYVSRSAVGKALATEIGGDPGDHFAWYKLDKAFPGRFVEATPEEKSQVEAAEAEELRQMQEAELAALAAGAPTT